MVSNASIPGWSSGPASLSSAAIEGLLVDQLHFQGLILTDSLSAGAIGALGLSVPQAAVEAIAAGADMIMFTATDPASMTSAVDTAIVQAVGDGVVSQARLTDAVGHVLTAKGVNLCPSSAG
jgi:beta-N-acetylhexosaminidase